MNPKIAENWKKSLEAFNAAKTAFENNEPDSEVKKELWMVVVHGKFAVAVREVDCELIPASIMLDYLEKIQNLGTKQALDITLKALKEYQNLVPKEYHLPLPTNC